ncbi:MAG: S1C family serine protease [Actinomycetota bacterium]
MSDPLLPRPVYVTPAAPLPMPPQRRGPGLVAVVLVATVVSLIVGGVAGLGGYLLGSAVDSSEPETAAVATETRPAVVSDVVASSIGDIVARVLPTVVSIEVVGDEGEGSGSGFIIRSDGYILTNNHVAAPAADNGKLTVYFDDGEGVPATIVGRNQSYDLAVLKVDEENLPVVDLGDSDLVAVGDPAIAIGAPLGLEGTVTSGIISSRDRPVTAGGVGDLSYINAIQTDAAINPGNSGGPLLNLAGQVIGINSAIATVVQSFTGEGGSIGLGFAIPINSAKRIADEIIDTGQSSTPIIGVSLDTAYTGEGARINEVNENGPADNAGLRPGDVILGIGDRDTRDATELVVAIRSYAPGDDVTLTFVRNGREEQVTLTLGATDSLS